MEDKVTANEVSIKLDYAVKRVDKLEEQVENLTKIYTSLELLAQELKYLREDTNDINSRLHLIEQTPAKRWEEITMDIIKLIIAGVIGYFMSIFTRKGGL